VSACACGLPCHCTAEAGGASRLRRVSCGAALSSEAPQAVAGGQNWAVDRCPASHLRPTVVLPPNEEETAMQIHYGPRGLHAELEAGFQRLLAARSRSRRIRRPGRTEPR
jgi:hypothetical protein